MLNPALYYSLQRVTGAPVKIKDEDVEAECTIERKYTKEGVELIPRIVNPGEQYSCCCPFCNDEHYHLSVNHLYGTDQVSHSTSLACCFHGCLSDPDNREELKHKILGFTNRTDPGPKIKIVKTTELHNGYTRLSNVQPLSDLEPDHRAINYLVNERGFTLELLNKYNVGFCQYSGEAPYVSGKVIIPIYLHGEQVGWQARCIGSPLPGRPKYFTSPGMHKREVLYNFDVAREQPYIVITEGVMDAWRVGDAGVCSFGKFVSVQQARLLAKHCSDKPIILMYDSDLSEKDEKNALTKLAHEGLRPMRVRLPEGYKDPDSMPTEMIKRLVEERINGKG